MSQNDISTATQTQFQFIVDKAKNSKFLLFLETQVNDIVISKIIPCGSYLINTEEVVELLNQKQVEYL